MRRFATTAVIKHKEPVVATSVHPAAPLQAAANPHTALAYEKFLLCFIINFMKVVILYRPNSEHTRSVEEFVHDFQKGHPERRVELISLDTPGGSHLAEVYDAVDYPAILAMSNDGQLLKMWQGQQFPLMNELAYYANG